MPTQTPPHSVELAASNRGLLAELVVTVAVIGVMLAALAGAGLTLVILGGLSPPALVAAVAIGLAVVVAIPLGARLFARSLARHLEARRHRRLREPAPVRLDTRPRGR